MSKIPKHCDVLPPAPDGYTLIPDGGDPADIFACDMLDCRHEDDAGYCHCPQGPHRDAPCVGPCERYETMPLEGPANDGNRASGTAEHPYTGTP